MIATEGEERFSAALQVIVGARRRTRSWRSCCRPWPATCSATRRRWPSTPRPARCARPAPPSRRRSRPGAGRAGDDLLDRLRPALEAAGRPVLRRPAQRRLRRPPRGEHRGAAGRRCSATPSASLPLEAYQVEYGKVGTPSVVIEDLTAALTRAIEELTRPVDAIKHQAKTVTVGISRTDETLLQVPLVHGGAGRRRRPRPAQLQHAAHAGRPRPGRRRGARASPATASRADVDDEDEPASVVVVDRGGIAPRARAAAPRPTRRCGAPSTGSPPSASVLVARGRSDGRTRGHRARGQGQPDHRAHAAARAASTTACRCRRMRVGAAGLPRPLPGAEGRGHRDRADVPRRPARRRSRSSTC